MAPLCQVGPALVIPPGFDTGSDAGAPVPAMYIAALPLPGLTEGIRLTITEVDRGIICESSLYSVYLRRVDIAMKIRTYLHSTSDRRRRGQSHLPYQDY